MYIITCHLLISIFIHVQLGQIYPCTILPVNMYGCVFVLHFRLNARVILSDNKLSNTVSRSYLSEFRSILVTHPSPKQIVVHLPTKLCNLKKVYQNINLNVYLQIIICKKKKYFLLFCCYLLLILPLTL